MNRLTQEWGRASMKRMWGLSVVFMVTGSVMAQEIAPTPAPPKRENIYDEMADAKAQVADALAKAQRDNTRVLVMFGGNWCGWCHKLHELFKDDKEIAKTLRYEYERVMLDVGKRDKNADLAKSYGVDLKKEGVPYLTVLDAEGKVLAHQETGSLEAGDKHDPAKVLAFLRQWSAKPQDARQIVDQASAKAKSDNKLLFLHVGAPWCGWCRKLDAFLARPDIASELGKEFLDVKIDLDRMTNAKEVAARIGYKDDIGLPWFAIVDAQGKPLATSVAKSGNVGFPAAPEEIAHFVDMLKMTGKNLSADQINVIENALRDAAKKQK